MKTLRLKFRNSVFEETNWRALTLRNEIRNNVSEDYGKINIHQSQPNILTTELVKLDMLTSSRDALLIESDLTTNHMPQISLSNLQKNIVLRFII